MKPSKILLIVILTVLALGTWAQGPNGSGTYYQSANGLTGSALKTKLYTIISKKTHSPSYDELIELYKKTDTRPDGKVRDWYSNTTNFTHVTDKAGSYSKEGDCYNREHTVPQSWGAPKADIVHVVPTDGYVNNRRGNLPFGEVGTPKYQSKNGYSKMGPCKTAGYSGDVFEPNDEVKGDIARIYFYMATCYEGTAQNWSGEAFGGTKYQPMVDWTYDMMVRWSKLDPVDDVEIARNNAVALPDVQGNRNPFVDYPGLEDYIWGDKKDMPFNYDNYEGGGDTPIVTVAQPVFSPMGGTYVDQVEVTITTATEGAAIYYTTNGVDANEQSLVYDGPITLTETTTLKAIAVKDDTKSYQTIATYTITDDQGQEQAADGTIALNSTFFDSTTGTISNKTTEDLTGIQNGVVVAYALGTGGQRYCGTDHIRMYAGNALTISVGQGALTGLEFELLESTTKTLSASVGTVSNYTWTGNAQSVTFSVSSGSGHAKLKSVKVQLAGTPTAIKEIKGEGLRVKGEVYDLQGRRIDYQIENRKSVNRKLPSGLYIRDGKKFIIR